MSDHFLASAIEGESNPNRFPRLAKAAEVLGKAVYEAGVSIGHFASGRAFRESMPTVYLPERRTLMRIGTASAVAAAAISLAVMNVDSSDPQPAIQPDSGEPFKYESSPAQLDMPVAVEAPAV